MKLTINNGNNAYTALHRNMSDKTCSVKKRNINSLAFKGGVEKIIPADVAQDVINAINKTIGEDYFTNILNKSGLFKEGKIIIPEEKFLSGLGRSFVSTCKHLILAPVKLFQGVSNKLSKNPKPPEISADDARQIATQILNKYLGNTKVEQLNFDKINSLQAEFLNKTALNITEFNQKYHSADERALNRVGTSMISAIFSGYDFYNITMLQKNNKKEAKKAEKERFHLEFERCFMSAGITFGFMSLFEKYINKSIVLNALTIVGASLVSEIITRKKKGVPLKKLTPQEAKELVQKQKALKNETKQVEPSTLKIPFKGKEEEQQIFKLFIAPKQKIQTSLSEEYKVSDKENVKSKPKKKKSVVQILTIASAVASAIFILGEISNGNFKAKISRFNLFRKNKNNLDAISKDVTKTFVDNIQKQANSNKLAKMFEVLTTKQDDINLTKMAEELEKMAPSAPPVEQKCAERFLLDKYINILHERMNVKDGTIREDALTHNIFLRSRSNIPIISSVAEGVTKLFKNIYQIFSLPGRAIALLADSFVFANSEKALKKFNLKSQPDKQIKILNVIIQANKNESYETVLKKIMENVTNFKEKPETGELASLSRTMVTLISSYFMINDYSNKVLIESEGKDVERAKEEYTDRLMQKLSNFFFNGTLMNLANTIFKGPLNNSLLAASIIPVGTEYINQILVRKSICQPTKKLSSKEDIIKYEKEQSEKEGFIGWWTKTYRKLTGKKTLSEKIKH